MRRFNREYIFMNLKLASSNRAISKITRTALVVVLVLVFAIMELGPVFATEECKKHQCTEKNNSILSNESLTSNYVDKAKYKTAKFKKSKSNKNNSKKSKSNKDELVKKPSISSMSAVLYCENTGEVLFEQKSRSRIAPLTTTKIITILLAIQNLQLSTEVEISAEAAGFGGPMALKEGEKISVESLIYGSLMANSSDATYALAEAVSGGDKAKFVNMMNELVKNMGCKETHFTNPVGTPEMDHYSTANDMMQIMKVASSNDIFRKISSAKKHKIKATNASQVRTLTNQYPEILKDRNVIAIQKCAGSKEGEGSILMSYNYKGLKLVLAVMGSPEDKVRENDAKKLIDYAVSSVRGIKVIAKGEKIDKAYIKGGEKTRVNAYARDDGYAYLPEQGSKELISGSVEMDEKIKAPVKKGTQVGTYVISVADDPVNKIPLIVREDINTGWLPSKIGISNLGTVLIILAIVLLIIIYIYVKIKIAQMRRRAAKKRKQIAYQKALRQIEIEEDRRRRGWNI